jgi:hypothetical protein
MVVLLAMLAIALPFIISQAAMPYGIAVSLRLKANECREAQIYNSC